MEVVVPAAPDDQGLTDSGAAPGTTDTTSTRRTPLRPVLVGALAVLLVASVGVLAWLLAGSPGAADDRQRLREQVMAQTEQFMLRMGTYGPDLLAEDGTMPEYRERVTEVITPKFAASFEQEVGAAEQLVAQAGVTREATVFATGVSSVDEDSARVLVAGSFQDSYVGGDKKERIQQQPFPFRLEVSLVKIDDEWLVDDFDEIAGAAEPGDEGTGSPNPAPSSPAPSSPAPSSTEGDR